MRRESDVERLPDRVRQRPSPQDWKDDELLTLEEAAGLFWPRGPLTKTSLRTAVRDGILDVAVIAGKILTTKSAIARMSVCSPRARPATAASPAPAPAKRPTDRELLRAMKAD